MKKPWEVGHGIRIRKIQRVDNESGYPMLLNGAETTPTEDVGGIYGFYEFMTVYRDKRHPEHEAMKA